jgi:hypothetical protein
VARAAHAGGRGSCFFEGTRSVGSERKSARERFPLEKDGRRRPRRDARDARRVSENGKRKTLRSRGTAILSRRIADVSIVANALFPNVSSQNIPFGHVGHVVREGDVHDDALAVRPARSEANLHSKKAPANPANDSERYDSERRADAETFVSRVDEVFAADAAAWDVADRESDGDDDRAERAMLHSLRAARARR